ncbi:MAG: hypothetical protein F9K22_13115 [Bacteroidetes bacterium]|nr:MAG: hypothetical protein F9K22_13115 [Bacteroidota bacterium]
MIRIAPHIDVTLASPYGTGGIAPKRVVWHGMHTLAEGTCRDTGAALLASLPSGHGSLNDYVLDLNARKVFCPAAVLPWFGRPMLESMLAPSPDEVPFRVETFAPAKRAVILNTIDYLYGHALLKLLNAERHLEQHPDTPLVVIVQDFLRWMVPAGAAEVWTVSLPLSKAQRYHPKLHDRIEAECRRFDEVFLSRAHSHPAVSDITRFTGEARHDRTAEPYRITFIWRDDRPWVSNRYLVAAAKRLGLLGTLRWRQRQKVVSLFERLRETLPNARFTVAGFGRSLEFPEWIDDQRVTTFTREAEERLCTVYAESRVVVGVHGSNMLLPSAHAGITVDLMPEERWGNLAQDVIFQETDPRMAVFRYRFLPISLRSGLLARIIATQLAEERNFAQQMVVNAGGTA